MHVLCRLLPLRANASTGLVADFSDVGQDYQGDVLVWEVLRGTLQFDTWVVPSAAIIASATLSVYVSSKITDSPFNLVVVSGSCLASTIVVADYGELASATTNFGSMGSGTIAASAYNNLALSSSAITEIAKGGTTRFGLRTSRDIGSNTPKLNGSTYYEVVSIWDHTTVNKPKLIVTYTLARKGYVWIENTDKHYFDESNAERYTTGTAV